MAACLLFVAAGVGLRLSHGLPGRYTADQRILAGAASDFWQRRGRCFGRDNSVLPGLGYCRLGDPAVAPDFLIWGDSHARTFRDGLDLAASEAGRSGLLISEAGCPPIIAVRKVANAQSPVEDAACFDGNARLLADLARAGGMRDVLLIGRWAFYADGHGVGQDIDNEVRLLDSAGRSGVAGDLLALGLRKTVDALRAQGSRVFILEQVPEFPDFSAYRLAVRVIIRKEPLDRAIGKIGLVDRADVERRQAVPQRLIAALAARGAITVLPTHDRFCSGERCSAWQHGHPLLFDHNHVTVDASYRLRSMFDPFFKGDGR